MPYTKTTVEILEYDDLKAHIAKRHTDLKAWLNEAIKEKLEKEVGLSKHVISIDPPPRISRVIEVKKE